MQRFGHEIKGAWLLEPNTAYLNHGTVGATPLQVLRAQQALQEEIERQPARFMLRELTATVGAGVGASGLKESRLYTATRSVAAFLGVEADDLAFVANATTGINGVLSSVVLSPGDEIVLTSMGYGAIDAAARYYARRVGARVVTADIPFPLHNADQLFEVVRDAVTGNTRLLIIDHVASGSSLIFPVARIAAWARERGVSVLVDGAHAPGMMPLELSRLGVDWYVGNLHKWAFAPRGCGFLWATREAQQGLHPPVISWGLDQGFGAEFEWTGTADPTPFLSAPQALAFMHELGESEMRIYNHGLATGAAGLLSERLGVSLPAPQEMFGSMVTLILPEGLGRDQLAASALQDRLLFEHAIEIPVHAEQGHLHLRLSAQVYNELADYQRLAGALVP